MYNHEREKERREQIETHVAIVIGILAITAMLGAWLFPVRYIP